MLNRTPIEWVINPDGSRGFTANPLRGKCQHSCPYCYAWPIHKRYGGKEEMTWHPEVLKAIEKRKKPSTIFVGSMYDCWGSWVSADKRLRIFSTALNCSRHTFLYLTKNPDAYCLAGIRPENAWYGVTVCNQSDTEKIGYLPLQGKRFISCEPLLAPLDFDKRPLKIAIPYTDWLIIGSLNCNGKPVPPEKGGTRLEWVLPIIEQADKHEIPVFIKNSLLELYPELPRLRALPYLNGKEHREVVE